MGIYSAQRRHIAAPAAPPRGLRPLSRPRTLGLSYLTIEILLQFGLQFGHDVMAAGLLPQLVLLLEDCALSGLNRDIITRAENIFHGHRDLLVAFNKNLPAGFQCTVPDAEERTPSDRSQDRSN